MGRAKERKKQKMIKNFIVGEGAFPVDGELIPDERELQDNLYLLNEAGEVISSREVRPLLRVGQNLFAALGTEDGEWRKLSHTLAERFDTMYLMQCGPVPVLMMRYLWRGNRTLLAAVPRGSLAVALRTPAAYAGVLFPQDLDFSPLSASKRMPADETVFRMAGEWAAPYRFLRAAYEEHEARSLQLMQFLKSRTLALARMCGVHALYYYSGIGYATILNVNYPRLMAGLAAIMMAVRRVAAEKTAHFAIEREGEGDPVLLVSFYAHDDARPPELFCGADAGEGTKISFFANPTEKGLYHVRFPFCTPPVEVTGLRAFSISQ